MSTASPEKLSEPTREEIEQALLSAFPDRASLAMMVYYKFGVNLETISGEANLLEVVSRLMIWAEAGLGLSDLVTRAAARNPDNQELRGIVERYRQLEAPREAPATPKSIPPTERVNLLPAIGARLKDADLAATRAFLFKGHRWLGRLFTMRPWKLAASFSILAILLLILPAYLIGVHLLRRPGGLGVGFWQSPDRSVLYAIGLPLLFAGTVWLSNYMRAVIETLVNKRVKVITTKEGEEATTYEQTLSDKLAKTARPLLIVVALLTLVIMFFDTRQIWSSYRQHYAGGTYNAKESDWRVAAIDPTFTGDFKPPPAVIKLTPNTNLLFDSIVYLFQAAVTFLILFWIAKFWLYLKVFSTSMKPDESPYRFNPLAYDPYRRLGLYPMGRLFNGFLLIVVGYLIYVFYHRLQMIRLGSSLGYGQIILEVFNPFNLLNQAAYHTDPAALTAGLKMLLMFGTLPLLIVSYFSLFTLRSYIMERREKAYLEHGYELEEARRVRNQARAKMLEEKIDLLEDASIWPNGDITAKRFLFIIIALGFTALIPPLLLYFVALGLVLEVWRSITRSRRAHRE